MPRGMDKPPGNLKALTQSDYNRQQQERHRALMRANPPKRAMTMEDASVLLAIAVLLRMDEMEALNGNSVEVANYEDMWRQLYQWLVRRSASSDHVS